MRIPPAIDMIIAAMAITPQWKSITGKAARRISPILSRKRKREKGTKDYVEFNGNLPIPIMTKNPVKNLPKSTTALPSLSAVKSFGFDHLPQMAFGSGATT